jgi:4-hydroxybenzoate polyprenyltransferase
MARVTVAAVVRSAHPGPSVAVTALAAILAWGFAVSASSATLVVLAVLFNQLSVGLSNDAIDAVRDREAGRRDKPVVSGEVTPATLWRLAILLAAASLVLSAFVHPGVLIAQGVFLLAGWLYNAGLKATVFSVVAYAVGFGALPVIVSFAALPAAFASWWIIVIAAGLGVAAHFGNVLPDRVEDQLQGVRGLPQRLPARTSAFILTAMIMAMSAVLVAGAGASNIALTLPFASVASAVAIAGGLVALRDTPTRWPFRAVILAAVILAGGLSAVLVTSG